MGSPECNAHVAPCNWLDDALRSELERKKKSGWRERKWLGGDDRPSATLRMLTSRVIDPHDDDREMFVRRTVSRLHLL